MKMKMMVAVAATLASSSALAAVTGNVGAFNRYDFRGVAQNLTGSTAVVQGGFDYAADSGFYVGTWASNVSWGAGRTELDLYGGYTTKINDTFSIDVGTIGYLYPEQGADHNNSIGNPNTVEFYAAAIVGPVTIKYFYSPAYFGLQQQTATSDGEGQTVFGHKDTTNNSYILVSGAYPLSETFSITYSGGYTKSGDKVWLDGPDALSGNKVRDDYFDYGLGVSKTLDAGLVASFGIVGTSFKDDAPGIVLGLKKTFSL